MSDKNDKKESIQMMPTIDMASMMDAIQKATKDKSKIDVVYELLKEGNLEFITEWPNANYTKWGVKTMTWRESVTQVLNLDNGIRYNETTKAMEYHPELDESETLVKIMEHQAKLKMTSHKRRRAQEVVASVKDDPNSPMYSMENKMKRSFLGLR